MEKKIEEKITTIEDFRKEKLNEFNDFKSLFEKVFGDNWLFSLETDSKDEFVIYQVLTFDEMSLIRDSIQKFGSVNIKDKSGNEYKVINIYCPVGKEMACLTDF